MEEIAIAGIILGIVALALWIYGIYDILKGSISGSGNKIFWLIIVIFFPIIGVLLYFLIGKNR